MLPRDHDYITLFGYWRGRDDAEAVQDSVLWTPIDLANACLKGIITPRAQADLVERQRGTLRDDLERLVDFGHFADVVGLDEQYATEQRYAAE